ncbi:N-acetylmuramoyl-L-alanine amidase [candidate division KSB1 bacterium]
MNHTKQVRLFLTIVVLIFISDIAHSQSVRINVSSEPQISERVYSLSDNNGNVYISAESFAEALQINAVKADDLSKIVLYLEDKEVTLTANNPFVIVGKQAYQMPLPVVERRNELHFPVKELIYLLDRYLPGDYSFDEVRDIIDIYYGGALSITDLWVEERNNGTLIHIETTKPFGEGLRSWFDDQRNLLTVQFYKGRLDTLQFSSDESYGLVLRTIATQHPEIASLTFRLSAYVDGDDIDVIQDGSTNEVIVTLFDTRTRDELFVSDVEQSAEISEIIAKEKELWNIDTIVIDPGHGGKDPGTIGPNGLYEKNIVLDIALILGELIRDTHLVDNVVYTRETDVFVPLQERAEIANNKGGKLFISIHINYNKRTNIRGFETYFLDPSKNEDALEVLEVVQRENNVVNLYEDKDPERLLTEEDKMILAITQSAFVKESEKLASFISEGIERKVNWPNKGVKQAGFLVLWKVSMPNALIEAGFISNPSQRIDLQSRAIKHRIAEGIYEGIQKFIEDVRR